jgi:hypothetical protein
MVTRIGVKSGRFCCPRETKKKDLRLNTQQKTILDKP